MYGHPMSGLSWAAVSRAERARRRRDRLVTWLYAASLSVLFLTVSDWLDGRI